MITSATHSGISFAYDDTAATLAATVDNISSTTGTIEMRGQSSKLRFHYDQLSDLPSATDWHGMFAHVHATGGAYYAHGGIWVELIALSTLKTEVAASTDFADFQSRIAAL